MSPLQRLIREPLVHFLAAGIVLFAAVALFRGDSQAVDDSRRIIVERRDLLNFLQYRANAFEPETFAAALDAMTEAELTELIDAYVGEEVLYREAIELGLDTSDNIIRQRMVQKMNFLLADSVAASQSLEPADIEAYFEANIEAYAIQPWATFTHVFFDSTRRGNDGAHAAAAAALIELNEARAGFNDAPAHGDRFPYLRNYVERTFEFVASHFGNEFASRLATLEPSDNQWRGPFRSAFGEHVVLMTQRVEQTYPTLDEIRADVERDLAVERSNAGVVAWTESIRESYRIEVGEIGSPAP